MNNKTKEESQIKLIEELGTLPDIESLDNEYYMHQHECTFNLQKIRDGQVQFMSE